MIDVSTITTVYISGVADSQPVQPIKCAPGLALIDNILTYTRGDGVFYNFKDGSNVPTMTNVYTPDGKMKVCKKIYQVAIDD